jgi:hypothetical protein
MDSFISRNYVVPGGRFADVRLGQLFILLGLVKTAAAARQGYDKLSFEIGPRRVLNANHLLSTRPSPLPAA